MNFIKKIISSSELNKIKNNLNNRPHVGIEITVTNSCNGNCSYCFENDHSKSLINVDEQKLQLNLLIDYCENFDLTKFNGLTITFWGGEPMMNFQFIEQILIATQKYQFINYFIYSNGTQFEKFLELIDLDKKLNFKNRMRIQLSYDGEPHNTIKRGKTKEIILKTAKLLQENKFKFGFKATLSYDMIKFLSEIWKSYEELYNQFGNFIRYCPTLDTTVKEWPEYEFEIWKEQIIQIARYEFNFYKKHKHFLMSWFNYDNSKMVCNLDYHINVHLDGNIYLCHGCPYSKNKCKNFILGNTSKIKSFNEVLSKKCSNYESCNECKECSATYCNICHITQVDVKDYINDWIKCMPSNKLRCKYFKFFGVVNNMLIYSLINSK